MVLRGFRRHFIRHQAISVGLKKRYKCVCGGFGRHKVRYVVSEGFWRISEAFQKISDNFQRVSEAFQLASEGF